MTTMLTEEQLRALGVRSKEPVRFIDPNSKRVYVLIDEAVYDRIRELLESFQPQDAYAASDRVFAPGWDDLAMDDYDRYEELKQ